MRDPIRLSVRCAAWLSVALAACGAPARDPSIYACVETDGNAAHPRAARYQSFVDRQVAAGIPGLVLLVRDAGGTWKGAGGLADLATATPMRTCQLGSVASITKSFVAATVLKLVEEGRLGLEDRIADHLPASAIDGIANADRATVRQVLNHSSGIVNYNDSLDYQTDVINAPATRLSSGYDYLRYARGKRAYFEPGAGHHYSNTNYLLLGWVIDQTAGEHHTEALRRRVLLPLGLSRSIYDWQDLTPVGVMRGYSELQGDGRIVDVTDFYFAGQYNNPAGGLHSTVEDLARFADALLRDQTLLQPATLAQMKTWVSPEPGVEPGYDQYGLGLELVRGDGGELAIGHTGGLYGYSAFMFHFPERDATVVALYNLGSDSPLGGRLTRDFVRGLLKLPYE